MLMMMSTNTFLTLQALFQLNSLPIVFIISIRYIIRVYIKPNFTVFFLWICNVHLVVQQNQNKIELLFAVRHTKITLGLGPWTYKESDPLLLHCYLSFLVFFNLKSHRAPNIMKNHSLLMFLKLLLDTKYITFYGYKLLPLGLIRKSFL